MARKRVATNLHQLSVKQVLNAPEGDLTDGGGLILRIGSQSASWVFRYTAITGKRREMGLGVARLGSGTQAGDSLTTARDLARDARDLLQRGVDPIDERDGRRAAAQALEEGKKAAARRERTTLARTARDYHERVIEPLVPTSTPRSGSHHSSITCRSRSGMRRSTRSRLPCC